ncbi:alpha/beta hydrolase [Streptomyces sp. NPDC050145]|uniref:alpha/beta hydrolase n=1 Tax=Streptomyces sp. NPDC050145 TaxID=3365602 RepID=UPI0037A78E44
MTRHLMLVHGAWHGARDWALLTPHLTERGFTVHTVDLPSSGAPGQALGDLRADAAAVREAVGAIDGPVTLVGHSYGGMVITEASARLENVDRLIYVAAFMLPEGVSVLQAVGGTPPPWWVIDRENRTVDVKDPTAVFFADCPADVASDTTAHLGLQSLDSFEQPLTGAGWTTIPSGYVLCERDAAIPPFAQEAMSASASTVVRMPTGHSPFLANPAGLADHITELTAAA